MATATYYDILGLESRQADVNISVQDVKLAYKKALLRNHPDKKVVVTSPAHVTTKSVPSVDEISLAYRTISHPELRAQYDRSLQLSRHLDVPVRRVHKTGLETVDLDALEYHEQARIWTRSCRCNDFQGFVVSEAALEEHINDGELTVGCRGCSLWLRVLFAVDD